MENGHSWSSIKGYTLSEIGVFFKTIVLREKDKKIEKISHVWMGTHLSKEGIKEVLGENGRPETLEPEELPVEDVNKEWRRLKQTMAGVT